MELWTVTVERMRIYAYHGVEPQERVVGNDFEVTVSVRVNAQPAAESDDVALTVSYAELADIVTHEMSQPSELLEHVASRIRQAICDRFPLVYGGSVTVAKLTPPMPANVAAASVSLSWNND